MSTDDKRINGQSDDGLAELMDAFGGYEEETAEDIALDIAEESESEEIAIELPEIPFEEVADEDPEAVIEAEEKNEKAEEPKKKAEKPKAEAEAHKKPKKEKKEISEKPKKEKKTKTAKPVSDESENEQKPVSSSRLVIVLTVICAAVALLLASVNHFTEAKIAENNEKAMLASIREIFDENVQAESVALAEDSELTSAYLVMKDGGICGYAASVAPNGFGGPLSLMVGIDSTGTVVGVEIVSMSETPGLGSRVGNDDFLSRFKGVSGNVSVDVISGATISSKAVMAGVNSVTADLLDLDAIAAERGVSVIPYTNDGSTAPVTDAPVSDTVTDAPVTEVPATDAPVTVAPVTEELPPDVTKGNTPVQNIVNNPNNVNKEIHAEYLEETAEYETLTTEPETTEPEETTEA